MRCICSYILERLTLVNKLLPIAAFLLLGIALSDWANAQSRQRPSNQRDRQSRMLDRMPLIQALDSDKNGEISALEIEAAVEALSKLDKNEDGRVDAEELAPSRGRGGRGSGGPNSGGRGRGGRGDQSASSWKFLSEKYDKNKDGKITAEEYDRDPDAFKRLDSSKDGELTLDDLKNLGRDSDPRPSSPTSAPKVGDKAPDFELTKIIDADKQVKLSSFADKKPVALIFGSCT